MGSPTAAARHVTAKAEKADQSSTDQIGAQSAPARYILAGQAHSGRPECAGRAPVWSEQGCLSRHILARAETHRRKIVDRDWGAGQGRGVCLHLPSLSSLGFPLPVSPSFFPLLPSPSLPSLISFGSLLSSHSFSSLLSFPCLLSSLSLSSLLSSSFSGRERRVGPQRSGSSSSPSPGRGPVRQRL